MTTQSLSRRKLALFFLESAGAAAFIAGVTQLLVDHRAWIGLTAARPYRIASAAGIWGFALASLLGLLFWLRRRADGAERVVPWLTRGRPLLVLWMVPWLWTPGALADRPLQLTLLTALAVLGTEWSLRARARARTRTALAGAWLKKGGPRLLAAVLVTTAVGLAYFGSVRVHEKMLSSNYDFGLFENLFWNTLHGRHGLALGRRYFVEHAEFLLYALLPFYAALPRSETLYALQALLMAGAAVPLFLLAERWLRSSWAALAIVGCYLSHPALHGPAFYDFHFLPLSAFFIAWAAYLFAVRPGGAAFWAALALAMACREDVALGVAAIGAGMWWYGRHRRTALIMLGVGAAWFVLVKFVWMRRYGGTSFTGYYSDLIPKGELGFGAVLTTLLGNPLYALSRLLTEQKLLLALQLLAPLAFLPLRYRRALFLLLPGLLVVGLANSDSAITRVHFHYSTHFLPYAFIAAIFALAVRSRRRRWPALAAMLLGSSVVSLHFGALFGERFKTSFHEVSFDWTAQDAERRRAFLELAELVPADASLSAGEYEGAQMARREQLFALKAGTANADYVLYSRRSLRWGGREEVQRVLRSGEYGLIDMRGDMALLGRGRDTHENSKALAQLR